MKCSVRGAAAMVIMTCALAATMAVPAGPAGAGGLTAGPSADRPAIASDSDADPSGRIVFQRFDPDMGKFRIYTIRPHGTGLRAITEPPANADQDDWPDWSPDGSRIVFRRDVDERSELIVVNADGSRPRNLTRSNCAGECLGDDEPAWSPDGRRIAFGRALGPIPPDGPPAVVGIFVMNADGSKVRQLTQLVPNSGTEDHTPSWSPDGGRIAFMRSNNTAQPVDASSIYTVDADGGDLTLVKRMPKKRPGSGVPEWSPDGRRILFDTYCLFGFCGQPLTGSQLFTIRPNGAGLRQLTHFPGNSYAGSWSPDGQRIVFSRNPQVAPLGDLYIMRRDGTEVRRLTHALRLDNHNADWGPAHPDDDEDDDDHDHPCARND